MVHSRKKWQTTPIFLPQEPNEHCDKIKNKQTPEYESPRSVGIQYAIQEKPRELTPQRMKKLGQSRNDPQLWMCLVMKVKTDAVKNNKA